MYFISELYSETHQLDEAIKNFKAPSDLIILEEVDDMIRIVKDDCYTFLNLKVNSKGMELNLLKMISEDVHSLSNQFDESYLNNRYFIEGLMDIFNKYNFDFKNKTYSFIWGGDSFIKDFYVDYGDGNNFNHIKKYMYKIIEKVFNMMNRPFSGIKINIIFKEKFIILEIKTYYEDRQSSKPASELTLGNSEMVFPKIGYLFKDIDEDIFNKKMIFENEKKGFYNELLKLIYDKKVNLRERFTSEFVRLDFKKFNHLILSLNIYTDINHLDLEVIKKYYDNKIIKDYVIEKLNNLIFIDKYFNNRMIQIFDIRITHQDKLFLMFNINEEFIKYMKNRVHKHVIYEHLG